ncbi:hypothetical protein [Desulfonatronum sp. SC1]|uniref:hypothetical protein n=1 Tax=Desulfonatronum sp. SC1 TaxID=2109626 RepID=UPI0011B1E6FE|nr:hypothetical protein [Desulfonatronum sp. SC1]
MLPHRRGNQEICGKHSGEAGIQGSWEKIIEESTNVESALREEPDTCNAHFESEIVVLSHNNSLFLNVTLENSVY